MDLFLNLTLHKIDACVSTIINMRTGVSMNL